jgi:hypothetical protein
MFSRDFFLRTHSKQNTFIYRCASGQEAPPSTAGMLREGQGASNKDMDRNEGSAALLDLSLPGQLIDRRAPCAPSHHLVCTTRRPRS